ncbi:restriction endonuclease subunit S [Succinimonas sp.]|uniref:restriction endonuclease subunit S n=1 Tax=Succinimonas sp. TaxID=1936151 RepID=UPI00386ECAE5
MDLTKLAQTGALPSYNASDVEDIVIKLPEKKKQEEKGRFFKQFDPLITLNQRKLEKLKISRNRCLKKCLYRGG